MNNLDIFLLVCFLTLAKCSKFSEAAETLHISQSSFSKNIQSLEQIFGTALFIRGSHGSVLTEAGHALMPYAENIVREYGKAEKLIASYRKNRPRIHSSICFCTIGETVKNSFPENLSVTLCTF